MKHDASMETAYDLAALAVRRRFAEQCPAHLAALAAVRRRDVAVYSGTFDSVQHVLERLRVPFTLDPPNPPAGGLAFVNCCSGSAKRLGASAAARHVHAGGWLVSSDWALRHLVEPAFPGTVRWNNQSTRDEVVAVEANLDSLWAHVVVPGADPQWWLEASSYPIEVLDEGRVRVESASCEMLDRYNAPAVGVRFAWGAGHVFHVVSHFWLKRTRVRDGRYATPCDDFLRRGMRLSEDGIAQVLEAAKVRPDTMTFATLQTAATSTELVAQLCVRAFAPRVGDGDGAAPAPAPAAATGPAV